jgi:hypothetical protein
VHDGTFSFNDDIGRKNRVLGMLGVRFGQKRVNALKQINKERLYQAEIATKCVERETRRKRRHRKEEKIREVQMIDSALLESNDCECASCFTVILSDSKL